jgi:hypothetical protein
VNTKKEVSDRADDLLLRSSTHSTGILGAAIDHDESPRTMLGVDVSMLTAGITGLLTMPWEKSYSISKNNVHGRAAV